jgi:phenylpropionate dioxygenase-like ring-hydroxylating dioxygenase large terminal subunit
MRHETQTALIDRALGHVAARTTDLGDAETAIAVERYLSAEHFERERTQLFASVPAPVALSAQLARPGDFMTLDAFGVPLLLTRDRDGALYAHVNSCRHRGTKLVAEPCGSGKQTFVCPYHSWSYGASGALLGIPHQECFATQNRERLGLVDVAARERFGIVWTIPARPEAGDPLGEALAGLADELDALALGQHVHFKTWERTWRGNWKLFIDGSLEAYHFRVVHENSIYPLFFDNVMLFDRFGHHERVVLPKRSISELTQAARSEWRLRAHANLVYLLFPNLVLLVQSDHVVAIAVQPVGVAESRISAIMLIPEGSARHVGYWEKNFRITVDTLQEDFAMGERVFDGTRSGTPNHFVLGRNELGIAAFHASLDRVMVRG